MKILSGALLTITFWTDHTLVMVIENDGENTISNEVEKQQIKELN
jgi:hypothetical protein